MSVAEPKYSCPADRVVHRISEYIPNDTCTMTLHQSALNNTNNTGLDMLTEDLESLNPGRERKRWSHYIPPLREHHSALARELDKPVSSTNSTSVQPTTAPAAFEQTRQNSLNARRKRRNHYIPREHGQAPQPSSPATLAPIVNTRCKVAGAGGVRKGPDFLELDGTTMSRIDGVSAFQLPVSCSGGSGGGE